MQSSRDVDIRSPRLSHVRNSSLDGIVRPELYKRTTTHTKSISAESPSQKQGEQAKYASLQEEGGEEKRKREGRRT